MVPSTDVESVWAPDIEQFPKGPSHLPSHVDAEKVVFLCFYNKHQDRISLNIKIVYVSWLNIGFVTTIKQLT